MKFVLVVNGSLFAELNLQLRVFNSSYPDLVQRTLYLTWERGWT